MRGAGSFHRFATATRRRFARRGVILLYHRVDAPALDPNDLAVTPSHFEGQLRILSALGEPLGLDEFERRRIDGTLPARAIAVTFDDGYRDNLTNAAPALARARVPATVFVSTGRIGSPRGFWWDELAALLLTTTHHEGTLTVHLDDGGPSHVRITPAQARAVYALLSERLRIAPAASRDRAIETIAAALGRPLPDAQVARACTTDELRALASFPGIRLGGHSVSHSVMSRQSPEELRRETVACRAQLTEVLGGHAPTAFAYPYGATHDISCAAVDAVRAAGYAMACANIPDAAWRASDPFRLPRHLVRNWDAATFQTNLEQWFRE
ncbi:MAG: polysaccharide deacetylase family protein [Gemmatimonadetes bacterium]|nr:polysaccharide deacetylase family protein [Gemmatimonadota bacterium]